MPFALLIIGIVLLASGVRNTQDTLFGLVKGDFTGPNNFVYWLLAILVIGLIGYVPKLKPISTGFLVLVVLVLFLSKGNPNGPGGGFFKEFFGAVSGTNNPGPSATGVNSAASPITVGGLTLQQAQAQMASLQNSLAQNIALEDALNQ